MEFSEVEKELFKIFVAMKKIHFNGITEDVEINKNERMVLLMLKCNSKDDKILLSKLRDELKVTPSNLTAIITSLENSGFIDRKIDKQDRRNIYLEISTKGREYTKKIHKQFKENITKYIEFMGEKDTKELVRLMGKTIEFFESRKDD